MTVRHTCNQTSLSKNGTLLDYDHERRTTGRQTLENSRNFGAVGEGDPIGGVSMPDQNGYIKCHPGAIVECTPTPVITDQNFATACAAGQWVCGDAEVTVSGGGTAVWLEGIETSTLTSTVDLNDSTSVFTITVIVSVFGSGELIPSAGGVNFPAITGTGTFEYEFLASSTAPAALTPTSNGFDGTVTEFNISECVAT